MLLEEIGTLDAVLSAHAVKLGRDFTAYGNHAYRVVNFCAALCETDSDRLEKIALTAAFHDLGIWTDDTFDYLEPSMHLACALLARTRHGQWASEVSAMIREHHKISQFRDDPASLIEPFRCADWLDVSGGLLKFGLPKPFLRSVFSTWPNHGFHRRLLQLGTRRLRTHPWRPLPMLRL